MYVEGSPYLELCELTEYEKYLVSLWYESGAVSTNGMGVGALTWAELTCWADRFFSETYVEWVKSPTRRWMPIALKQHTLLDYELHIIKFLSQEYASEYSAASDPKRQCPKEIDIEQVDGKAESVAMGNAFISLFGSTEQKAAIGIIE